MEMGEKWFVCIDKDIQTDRSHNVLFEDLHRRLCEVESLRINPHHGWDRTYCRPAVEEAILAQVRELSHTYY